MFSKQKLALIWIFLAILGASSAFIYFTRKENSGRSGPIAENVTIAQFGDVFLYAPLYIAKDLGFFKKRGYNVDFISTGGDEKTWAAVASRNAQFGVADPTFIAISGEKGLRGIVVASIIAKAPFWGIAFDDKVPKIVKPSDLNGFSVATFPSPSTAYTLQKQMFLDGGLKPNIREGSFGSLIALVKARRSDIALEIEPNVSQATQTGARVLYGLDTVYGDFQTTGITVLPSLTKENPKMVEGIVCSVAEALAFLRSNPDQSVNILIRRFPEIDRNVAKSSLERMTASNVIPFTPKVNEASWNNAIKLRKKAGDLTTGGIYSTYVNNSFADNCNNM
jgi:NitT/TauT family transport system substrate-binding protein